jgi:hypothetical protein
LPLAAAIVPVHAHVEFLAREADAPARAARDEAGQRHRLVTQQPLRAAVGEDLHAPRPARQEREHLLVVEVEALHPNRALHVLLRRHVVGVVGRRIDVVLRQELRVALNTMSVKKLSIVRRKAPREIWPTPSK